MLFVMTACGSVNSEKKPKLSEMSEEECLEFIKSKDIEIPDDLNKEGIGALVKKTIVQIEENPDKNFVVSYTVTLNFLENIRKAVNEYYGRD